MEAAAQRPKRILLGQLAAHGDCLYATAVARQIKADYPGCHLTWAIGTVCRPLLDGNPHVDAVWEIPLAKTSEVAAAWAVFTAAANERLRNGEFDAAYLTQIYPANFRNYDGTVRASIFRGYPRPISVPVAPVMHLRENEIENVRQFVARHQLDQHAPVILLEFNSNSGQSFVDAEFALSAAAGILEQIPDCRIVMSSHAAIESPDPRIISGHALSFRENAELTKYCALLIGCSSGITWLCTSNWAKPLPTIQLLTRTKGVYASVAHDHEHFGLATDHIIEMTECPVEDLRDCAVAIFEEGFASAKKHYHVRLRPDLTYYLPTLMFFVRKGNYRDALLSNWHILRRYGPRRFVLALNLHTLIGVFRHLIAGLAARLRG